MFLKKKSSPSSTWMIRFITIRGIIKEQETTKPLQVSLIPQFYNTLSNKKDFMKEYVYIIQRKWEKEYKGETNYLLKFISKRKIEKSSILDNIWRKKGSYYSPG